MKALAISVAAVLAANATLPSLAGGGAPAATGTATVENGILTLSGLVTNITAEAELGAGVTQVVMTAGGGVAFGASVAAARNYVVNGTGIVSVAGGKRFAVTVPRLSTIGHTLVKDGPGTLYFSDSASAVGNVATPTRWVVKEGELRIRPGGSFWGGHNNTTNLAIELREGTTFYQEQEDSDCTHNPMGLLEMTGAQFIYGPSKYNGASATRPQGNAAFKGGVLVHASATPSYMTWPLFSHLNHCNSNCTFDIESGGKLIVDGVLTNGMQSTWPKALSCTFTKRGGGELVLLKRNGWTGGTVFKEGTITVADPEALGTSTLTIAGDVTINVPVGVTFVCPPLATDGTHTLAVTGGGVFTQPDSVPEGLTIADNTAGNASPLVGSTLHLAGGCQTVNVAADTIITSMVDDGSGAGKYTDIVKTGAGILTLPTGISGSYRNLTVKEGMVSVANESCFGWGETVVSGGGIRFTANITQTRTSRPVIYQGSGTIDVPAGLTWKFTTNSFACASAVVTKTGAGTWKTDDPLKNSFGKYSASRWIIHEGKLKCCSGDMFAGYTGSHNLVVEVHEDAIMELNSADHHLPVCAIVLRGGTLYGFYGQYTGSEQAISGGSRWKGWGLNGPITVLPSLNGKPSRIVARASHLHHGNDPQATTFDVHDGATLEIDAALEPGRANSNANPNAGGFVKTGGGTLRLLKPCGAKGLIDIREGTVELAEGARFNPAAKVNVCPNAKLVLGDKVQMANTVDLASGLCASADVWLDASRLSLADGSTVASVPNLGTAGGDFAKFTWTAGSWRIPDLPTYKANGINGKGVLNFNGVQALCLPTYTNKTENLQVFFVAEWTSWTNQGGAGKWGGPMSFGNRAMTGDDNKESGVLTYQHMDSSSVFPMTTLTKGAKPSVGTADVGTPYLVSSCLTRTTIGSTVYVSDDMTPAGSSATHAETNVNVELVCVGGRTAVGGAAQVKSATPTSGADDRMYIGYIGEMLAFTRTLSADEENQVLAYLKRKWFNSTAAVPEETEKALANTVYIEVPEGAEASYVANVATATDGANLFELAKTGAGTLRYGGAVAGGAILDVKEGGLKLKDGRLPPQVDVWIDASDSSTIALDAESRVTNLVNKGSAGGSFVRNARREANVPFGPTVKEGAEGMNGNPVLAFDGNEALALCSYTNFTAPRSLYVYFVARRTKYVDEGGQGKWGGLFAFGSTTQSGEDQDQKGVCYLSQGSATALSVDHGVYSTASIAPPALEAPAIYYFFNTTNGYLFAVEANATSVTAIPRTASTDENCEPFQIDILQLGGRLMNFGQPQWFGDGDSRNRFGFFDFAEMIVTTVPLGEHQEAELLDYLRRKWLNKGSGSATPPAWLTGIPATPATDADTALVMADGTSLRHETDTKTLGALVTDGTVDWTRVWDGGTTASFPLFAVDGDVSLGTVNLAPEPLATRVKVMDWTGDLQNAAMWRLKGERIGALGVTLRDDGKAYWIISVGTAIHLR